jgi:hypothetical protein
MNHKLHIFQEDMFMKSKKPQTNQTAMQGTKSYRNSCRSRCKKAFDSVDHNYMLRVLEAYGFGLKFISWKELLNKDLKQIYC